MVLWFSNEHRRDLSAATARTRATHGKSLFHRGSTEEDRCFGLKGNGPTLEGGNLAYLDGTRDDFLGKAAARPGTSNQLQDGAGTARAKERREVWRKGVSETEGKLERM